MPGFVRCLYDWFKDAWNLRRDIDAMARVIYELVDDIDHALEIGSVSTVAAFGRQWEDLPTGRFLLSDPWFRENVTRILCEEELLLRPEWFEGKVVLDAGCGNGRWSYGLAKLGARMTCVDGADSALAATRVALEAEGLTATYVKSALEDLDSRVRPDGYDLVFCWGVLHHCVSFTRALDNLTAAVRPGGVLYLYLYGKGTITSEEGLRVFRDRLAYNMAMDDGARRRFLLRRAHGDKSRLHEMHDIYAPLINRRFSFEEVCELLGQRGFTDVRQTIVNTEIFCRATRADADLTRFDLPLPDSPYWFESSARGARGNR